MPPLTHPTKPRVVELFAGVGGFRIGLERSGWDVVWANQWEPSTTTQHAFDCYVAHFETGEHVCEDIHEVMNEAEAGRREIPDHELLVGGFPCQDYSVAKTLNQAAGIVGKKGVLWWEIHRLLIMKRPPYLFLENVDRLLKSPTNSVAATSGSCWPRSRTSATRWSGGSSTRPTTASRRSAGASCSSAGSPAWSTATPRRPL